jgi:hypothetical protein
MVAGHGGEEIDENTSIYDPNGFRYAETAVTKS